MAPLGNEGRFSFGGGTNIGRMSYSLGQQAAVAALGIEKIAAPTFLRSHVGKILDANRRLGTVTDLSTALRKTREELDEFEHEVNQGNHEKALSELGDTLLATHLMAGRYAHQYGGAPHLAAVKSADKVVSRLRHIQSAVAGGMDLKGAVQAAKAAYP